MFCGISQFQPDARYSQGSLESPQSISRRADSFFPSLRPLPVMGVAFCL